MNDEEQAPPQQETTAASADRESGGAPEISRRVGSILDAVEREAARLRQEARDEAARYLDHARRRADDLVAERQRRIAELSDELMGKAEVVVARLDDAAPVRQGFENLVRALGDAAERLSQETEMSHGDFAPPSFHGAAGAAPPAAAPQPPPARGGMTYPTAPDPASRPQPPPPQPSPYPPPPPAPHPQAPPPPPPPAPTGFDPARGFTPQPHPARAPSTPGWGASGAAAPAPAPGPGRGPGGTNWRELDDARMLAIQMAASGATRATVREQLHRELAVAESTAVLDEVFGAGSGEDARVPWTAPPR